MKPSGARSSTTSSWAELMMDPDRFFLHVTTGVVVLQGRVEQRSLIPWLVRAVHGVEGVVQVENCLAYDVDDRDADWVTG
jgi:osmotically-inducible protein OsmY